MSFRKFTADQVFDGFALHSSPQVVIAREDGVIEAVLRLEDAGSDVEHFSGILTPGFVNCHCHLELSHMRSAIPEMTGLSSFVLQVIQNRHFAEEIILSAMNEAEAEMFANGIVAVGDICNNTLSLPQKMKGNLLYHNFIEASGFLPELAAPRFQRAVDIFTEYDSNYSATGANSIVPHAPYSVSEALWEKIIQFPGNRTMCIHNQETAAENAFFLNREGEFVQLYQQLNMEIDFFSAPGTTSFQHILEKFLPGQSLMLVHNVSTSREDLHFARRSQSPLYWCLCPNANLYITGELPDINLLREEHCTIVLGTDSLASNHQLSILAEIQTIRRHFPLIPIPELLGWATLNGAKSLQMDHILGSFEKGKKPGIVLCESDLSASRRLI